MQYSFRVVAVDYPDSRNKVCINLRRITILISHISSLPIIMIVNRSAVARRTKPYGQIYHNALIQTQTK